MQMDIKYQHPSIQLYLMGQKFSSGIALAADQEKKQAAEFLERESNPREGKTSGVDEVGSEKNDIGCSDSTGLSSRDLTDWEVRRCGAMAARLLRDVKIN